MTRFKSKVSASNGRIHHSHIFSPIFLFARYRKKILSKSPKPIMATSKSGWAISFGRLKIRQLLGGNSAHELLSPGLDSVTGEHDK